MNAATLEQERSLQRGNALGTALTPEERIIRLERRVLRLEGIVERLSHRRDQE